MIGERVWGAVRASGWHLLGSLVVASLAAALVFGVWFPYPYRELVGGRELFLIVVAVDVVCGPLLTLVLFNHLKSRRELLLDLSVVALIQVSALTYGIYTVAQARPVYLVFEVDRFRAVTYSDIRHETLKLAKDDLQKLGMGRPKVIGVREPSNGDEMFRSLELSLAGYDPAVRPDWWVPYDSVKERVLHRAKPLSLLRTKYVNPVDFALDKAIGATGMGEADLLWLPVTSFRSTEWVALLDKQSAEIVGFAPIDGF